MQTFIPFLMNIIPNESKHFALLNKTSFSGICCYYYYFPMFYAKKFVDANALGTTERTMRKTFA